jgi:3D (Asp-Asp-Asp) domain-containing protein
MDGVYVAEDTGVSANRIDVFFNEHDEALQFGVRDAEVYIVD